MTAADSTETVRVALELFPNCAVCGFRLDKNDLTQLVAVKHRPNRYAHRDCSTAKSAA